MKKIILLALLIAVTFSCEDFEGWNVDTKKPSEVPASFLVTSSQKDLFRRVTGLSVNWNNYNLYAQYWTQTQYVDESNYDMRSRDVGGTFSLYMYRDVLIDLQDAARIINEDEFISTIERESQLGTLEMLNVYVWSILVDNFGYMPYSEALQGVDNLLPVYDSDAAIYADLFRRLDAGLALLSKGGDSFGDADLVYGGSTEQWMKFGNSLKLRMAVRISDVDAANATKYASEAFAAGVFESNADNASFPFETAPPNTNENWVSLVQSGRNDYVLCATFVDLINPLNDPRASTFMADNYMPYQGATYGAGSSYVDYTHIGDDWHQPDFAGTILDYAEVQFLIAEAIERGLVAGNAEMYYNAAITGSIEFWTDGAGDAATYLAQPSVAYATAGANWKETIGTQKYIALYGRGFEAWTSWRLLDYPQIMQRPDVASDESVPRRLLYGNDEGQVNGANYEAGSAAMGGDLKTSRVFWDVGDKGN